MRDAILDLVLNLVSLVFFKLWLYSLLKMKNNGNKPEEERERKTKESCSVAKNNLVS